MSRGPGALQRRIIETLALYHRLGPALGWRWCPGSRHAHGNYASESAVRGYERGQYIHVWMLIRDLGVPRDRLSRALAALERQGLVYRLAGDLEVADSRHGTGSNAKFAALTQEGEEWLKRQQLQSDDVGA